MTVEAQALRAERFAEIGDTLRRDAGVIVEKWAARATAEQPTAPRLHHAALLDHLPAFLAELADHLAESAGPDDRPHCRAARAHGEQRWEVGWSLTEVVRDYRILRLVTLEHLDAALDRPLTLPEVQAVGLGLDDAIEASVDRYVRSRDEQARRFQEAHDAETQRAAEELLRWKEVFLRASWGVAIAEPAGQTFLAVNPAFARMHGRTPAELVGRPYAEVIAPDARGQLPALLGRALAGGWHEYEVRHRRADGSEFPVLTDVTAHRDPEGRVLYWAANFQDVSAYRRAEAALKEADRRKDEFLALLAHELRNPLAPIRNAVEVLRTQDVSVEVAWVRDIIDRQARQLARLVDDLMEVSRITRGKLELRRERVDASVVATRAAETCRALIDRHRHELTLDLPADPIPLEADPARLEQVLCNLLNNAAKYSEEGSRISLSVRRDDGQAVLSVRDSGVGIPSDLLPRIFDPFMQADQTRARSQGGLGIGLALVKSLVELHGGTVQAISAGLGKGSEFVVRLPAPAPAAARPAAGQGAGPPATAARRVLVVDDDKDAAESLARLLRAWGHEPHTARDGLAALAAARQSPPDLVLCDIGLPGMDGLEIARRLREEVGLGGALLVALTGYGQEEDRRLSREAGFDHHLVKPVDLTTLRALLASVLPARAPGNPP